jgi:thiol-disulfide isomerase/thioredoxin
LTASTPRQPVSLRRAIRGALEGASFVGIGIFLGGLITGQNVSAAGLQAVLGAVYGAVMFAAGRAFTGKLMGAVAGGLAGVAIGFVLGGHVLGDYVYEEPHVVQADKEAEIAGPTLQGQDFDLRAWRGKVVLVDFWATWCVPCVAELPNVRAVYDRYHKDGFEIVGVNLDSSRAAVERFVAQKQIPWPQIFFPNGPNPLALQYKVGSIPRMMLVDQDGRLAFDDLPGELLGRAVAGMLGKSDNPGKQPGSPQVIMKQKAFPLGRLLGSLAGCLVGSFAGAWAERAFKGRVSGPAAPMAKGLAGPTGETERKS